VGGTLTEKRRNREFPRKTKGQRDHKTVKPKTSSKSEGGRIRGAGTFIKGPGQNRVGGGGVKFKRELGEVGGGKPEKTVGRVESSAEGGHKMHTIENEKPRKRKGGP